MMLRNQLPMGEGIIFRRSNSTCASTSILMHARVTCLTENHTILSAAQKCVCRIMRIPRLVRDDVVTFIPEMKEVFTTTGT